MATVYLFTFPNKKYYVGFSKNHKARWRSHKSLALSGKKNRLYDAIRKYGFDNIKKEVIFESDDINLVLEKEFFFISEYNSIVNGYNMLPGGMCGPSLFGESNPSSRRKGRPKSEWLTPEQLKRNNDGLKEVMTGSRNHRARKIRLICPNGIEYQTNGNLQEFCKNHDITFNVVVRYLSLGLPTIPEPSQMSRAKNRKRRDNTTGWSVFYI